MKDSKIPQGTVRQNGTTEKSSQKHDANLQKNSTLYFQIGLILCLLAAYGLLEMQFESTLPNYVSKELPDKDDRFTMEAPNFKVYVEPKTTPKTKTATKKVMLIDEPTIIEDNEELKKVVEVITSEQNTTDEPFDPNAMENIETPDEPLTVDFINVEQVPIYPGCENRKSNAAKRQCMSDKIKKLVRKKFNGNIASEYGLTGVQRIDVQFQIDKNGKIGQIKTRAPHPKLEDEALRVINKIPEMQPGMQRDKPVGVRYTLPIMFKVQ